MGAEQVVLLKVFNGKKKIYNYRFYLINEGFEFVKKAYGKSYYKKKISLNEEMVIDKYKEYCSTYNLNLQVIKSEFLRSYDYRKKFFDINKGFLKGHYFCIYCGKIISRKNTTIDHIYPVDRISQNTKYQKKLQKKGIENINDYKNLGTACKSCNSKKASKMGLWIIRAYIGKFNWLWCVRWAVRIGLVIACLKLLQAEFLLA